MIGNNLAKITTIPRKCHSIATETEKKVIETDNSLFYIFAAMIRLYRFFQNRRPLMYLIMVASFLVFLFFGLKIKYEEDISSLLPTTSVESQLAFSSIELKDKVYLQVTSADKPLEPEVLAERMNEFTDLLLANDTASGFTYLSPLPLPWSFGCKACFVQKLLAAGGRDGSQDSSV